MATAPDPDTLPAAPLLPAGRRWGTGAMSVAPYLRDAWSMRPRNPVFTAEHLASVVWPLPRPRTEPNA